ncbi:hypothetical protein Asp14428_13660 [Actinoplanes sp. NBRC 14428]|nr:hypothetical protein Asp14428_13660 [Actinoplanes sp. NBRC 14428]
MLLHRPPPAVLTAARLRPGTAGGLRYRAGRRTWAPRAGRAAAPRWITVATTAPATMPGFAEAEGLPVSER